MDFEDSVSCVDAQDKIEAYRVWLGLMKGNLTCEFEKAGRTVKRGLVPDTLPIPVIAQAIVRADQRVWAYVCTWYSPFDGSRWNGTERVVHIRVEQSYATSQNHEGTERRPPEAIAVRIGLFSSLAKLDRR